MLVIVLLALAIWFGGRWANVPPSARWIMLGLLYIAILAMHIVLPDGHPLRDATGDSEMVWLAVGALAGLIVLYRQGLKRVRVRAKEIEDARDAEQQVGPFSDAELNRYARHIVLREIGGGGQRAIKSAEVLVIGAGGLGSPVLQYLAAAGVGVIGVIDDDAVENTNLQRQVIHTDDNIGMPKVFSAKAACEAQNPFITIRPYNRRLTEEIAADLFADYDLIIDGTDNFETRYLSNRVAASLGKPLISGALTQWEGQLSVFDPAKGGPCYRCVFPEAPAPELAPNCAEAGVIGPLPGVVGTMMAVEALKIIADAGHVMRGEMLIYDALYGESRRITLNKREDCPDCGPKAKPATDEGAA
ncbi:MAG: HesA/MoeB/ThiF family protein [Pseudomonadota bacterium]